jgi:predicted nucleic acid-binding protein
MNASRIFMDTAFVLALLNQNDKYHEQAKAILPLTRTANEVF